jgi:hypothetical protein
MKAHLLLLVSLVLCLLTVSCSDAPKGPQPGTPAFYWAAAKEMYHAGNYSKANDDLMEITRSENEFTARARAMQLVLSAGLTSGYRELADIYDAGAKANRQNPMPFRKESSTLRSMAATSALELAETVHASMAKDNDAAVLLAFEYPTGSASEPPGLKKVGSGMLLQDSEKELLQLAMVQRGVVRTLCRMVGNPDDTAKTVEMFKAPEVKVPRETWRFAAAKMLFDQGELFDSKRLDQPNRLKLMCDEASQALKTVPPNKETKALDTKIQAALKKIKAT